MERREQGAQAPKRSKLGFKTWSKRCTKIQEAEKGPSLIEAPPWLLAGLYLVCHRCQKARWTTSDGVQTMQFTAFQNRHHQHEIEFMAAVRFLKDFVGTQRYKDIDRPKLKRLVMSFRGPKSTTVTPFGRPDGPEHALAVQREMRRRHQSETPPQN